MSAMVERVARAICESELMNPDDVLGGWLHWQDAARAAIEAMREPTEAMQHVGLDAYDEAADLPTNDVYREMINEALVD